MAKGMSLRARLPSMFRSPGVIDSTVCPVNPRRLIGRYRDELPAVTFF